MDYDENKIVDEAEIFLYNHGITLSDLILLTGKRNSALLLLNREGYKKFAICYEKIRDKDFREADKGKLLEQVMYSIFTQGYSTIWDCRKNCRTSTNEIDLQLNWTENARLAHIDASFPCFGESFLCECKNYKGAVNVTYVGKFYSLLKVTNSQVGILISWEGISGRGSWSDSKGLIKKIALRENVYIIVIDKDDLKKIYEKEGNILSIIYDKYIALKNEIDYSTYIKPHENEEKFKNESKESL